MAREQKLIYPIKKTQSIIVYKIIGKRIKLAREKLGMSQDDLAVQVGVLRTSITNLEAGRQKLPLEGLYQVAEVLQIKIKDLLP